MISAFFTRRRKPAKPVKCDPQKHLLYNVEREFMGSCVEGKNKRRVLEEVLTHACRKYKVSRPQLRIVRRDNRVFGWCNDEAICLNAKFHGDNLLTLLHETAHWIVDQLFDETDEELGGAHGPAFVGIYMHLLHGYKILPIQCSEVLFAEWQLDWDKTLVNPYSS